MRDTKLSKYMERHTLAPGDLDGKEFWHVGDPGSILGWEYPLEKGMATHSSILTWRIPQTKEPGGLPSMGLQRSGHD